ncbi:MAG: DUF2608 domain-containing protein [Candidatus Rickettsia vulgarisii]
MENIEAGSDFLKVYLAQDILSHVKNLPNNTIIFVDVDGTIITPSSKTFRTPPYNKMIENIRRDKDKYKQYEQIISNWRLQRKVILLDNNWPDIVKQLQDTYLVYGLTKMDIGKFGNIESMEEWRYQELKSLGVSFSMNDNLPKNEQEGSIFYKGIFFTGDSPKSQTLEKYTQYLPKFDSLVMIDDRSDNLEDIGNFCNKHSINCRTILFSGLEKLQDRQDPDIANFQQQHLIEECQWLEDEEAERIIKNIQ